MKNDIKLYNVMFPIWFLIIFPIAWMVILPVNFFIDSLVLLVSARLLKLTGIKEVYKKSILKVWMIGFGADFVGAGILFLSTNGSGVWYEYLNAVSWNPFDNWYAILFVTFATAVTGILIYFGNLKLVFQGMDLEQRSKRRLALALAIFTAPYVFFYPSALINGGSVERTDFLTNHFVRSDEFRLEAERGDGNREDPIILSYYQSEVKDAINTSKKISNESTRNSQPDYTFYFYNRDYTEKRGIPIWFEDGTVCFQYENAWYEMNQRELPPLQDILEEISETRDKNAFKIIPDPDTAKSPDHVRLDKEGNREDSYPLLEDSTALYYFPDKEYFYTAVIKIDGMEQMELYAALDKGLITPRQLIDYGLPLKAEPRVK